MSRKQNIGKEMQEIRHTAVKSAVKNKGFFANKAYEAGLCVDTLIF
jgi:hypothetical protein